MHIPWLRIEASLERMHEEPPLDIGITFGKLLLSIWNVDGLLLQHIFPKYYPKDCPVRVDPDILEKAI